jgi:hypothetical protein
VARTAVVVGTASAVAGGVQHHQQQKYAAQDAQAQADAQQQADAAAYQEQLAAQQAQQAAAATAAAAAPAGTPDLTAQIMQLSQLKDQGVLTDEEFASAKAKLLAG